MKARSVPFESSLTALGTGGQRHSISDVVVRASSNPTRARSSCSLVCKTSLSGPGMITTDLPNQDEHMYGSRQYRTHDSLVYRQLETTQVRTDVPVHVRAVEQSVLVSTAAYAHVNSGRGIARTNIHTHPIRYTRAPARKIGKKGLVSSITVRGQRNMNYIQ